MEKKELLKLKECLELLNAIHLIEYHNKNWLPTFAIKSEKLLWEEKLSLITKALKILNVPFVSKQT